jgi:hypothetical protein
MEEGEDGSQARQEGSLTMFKWNRRDHIEFSICAGIGVLVGQLIWLWLKGG